MQFEAFGWWWREGRLTYQITHQGQGEPGYLARVHTGDTDEPVFETELGRWPTKAAALAACEADYATRAVAA